MSDPLDDLFWRDEILEILFWLRGEGLSEAASAGDLVTFLDTGEALAEHYLEQLVEEGYTVRLEGPPIRFQLTELGVKEGGRRFADDFAGLTKQGHGECNDPACVCKTEGPEACVIHGQHNHSTG